MAITNKLKPLLDQPVWEWTRFNVQPGQTSAMTAPDGSATGRYLYNLNGANFSRFDAFTDAFQLLNSPISTPVGLADITYKSYDGYYSRAISGTTSTINGSFINGKICKGKKVRIYSGTNDGAERVITDVSAPIIVDYVVASAVSTASPVSITDGTKAWQINQWRGYQYRIISGNAKGIIKRIIYNNANTIFFADGNYLGVEPRLSYEPFKAVPSAANDATKSVGVIEYQTATFDSPFDSVIDDTTRYTVLGGGIWMVTASAALPFYTLQYYDVLSDAWSQKSTYSSFYLSQIGGTGSPPFNVALERVGEYAGSYLSGSTTSATLRTVTDSTLSLTPNRYANYQLRLSNGQTRVIKEHTATVFTFYRDLSSTPSNGTTFEIYADNDKIFMSGVGSNTLAQYSIQRDAWTQGEIHDSGMVRNITIKRADEESLPVTSLTYTSSANAYGVSGASGYVTGVTPINHWYKVGDVISIRGVTSAGDSVYNVTDAIVRDVTSSTTFIYTVNSAPTDTTIINTANAVQNSTTVMTDTQKNWGTNEHRGKILFVSTGNATNATSNARLVYANAANNLTTFAFGAAHTIFSKYHIQDIKSFGADSGIGNNTYNIVGNLTNASNRITGISDFSGIKLNAPLLRNGAVPPNTRIIGIDEPKGAIVMSANATASVTGATIIADERLTNGWGIANSSIVSFKDGDITVPISALTHSGGTATATTVIPHGYSNGDLVSIRGVSIVSAGDASYMVTYVAITVTGPSAFTYSMSAPTNNTAAAAAGSSLTQLTDGGKNWPVNFFAGARGKIVAGTGVGQEFTIATNTQTSIVFSAALVTAPDSTSVYVIYPNQARGQGHILKYIGNNSDPDTKGKYLISVRGGNTSNIERFNITTSEWEFIDAQPLSIISDTFGPGTTGTYDGDDRIYLQKNVTNRFVYMDVNTQEIIPWGQAPNPTTPATILAGNKCEIIESADGLKYLYFQKNETVEMFRTLLFV